MEGTILAEKYQVVARLGEGAAGEVYLVDNLQDGRREALKILKGDLEDRTIEGRFKREVRATQMLTHQNIVALYDSGRLPDGRLFVTMEAVPGSSLDKVVHQRGPLPIHLALGILGECADALHHAHERDVVHRDIKPHNIILSPHPNGSIVKILDFGLAKILSPGMQESMVLSREGAAFGTPAYMSPEQCMVMPPEGRTDIYSLGCVAFELLIGEPPFKGKLAQLFAAHLNLPPRPPSKADPSAGIPPQLDEVILTCLAKDPAHRFQTGGDLCAALQSVPGYRPLRVYQ